MSSPLQLPFPGATRPSWRVRISLLLAFLAAVFLGAGCATQRIDWDARVGNYHYDDAVRELGPPYKQAHLSDGSIVADWLMSRGMRTATSYGAGWSPYAPYGWGGPSVVVVDPPAPDRLLRLSFDPQGRLTEWRRVYQ